MNSALRNSAFDRVVLAIKRAAPVEVLGISQETRLTDDLGFGGFGRLKLAIYLEEMFSIELSDDVLRRFVTVADIVNYLSRR